MVKIHGKEYRTVNDRVNLLNDDVKGAYSLTTELLSWESGVVIMKAELRFREQIYTGHAYEKEGSTQINKTSALENCETSAIGRALAAAGYGGEEYASANEVQNAIQQQNQEPVKNRSRTDQETQIKQKRDLTSSISC